jgi:hypothetical protein
MMPAWRAVAVDTILVHALPVAEFRWRLQLALTSALPD